MLPGQLLAATEITNTARMSWYPQDPATAPGQQQRVAITASVLQPLVIQTMAPTDSTLTAYVPSAAGSSQIIKPTGYRDGNNNWLPVPNAGTLAGSKPALPTSTVFASAATYVCVADGNRNADSTMPDSIRVTVSSGTQQLALELTETGNATGRFCGYFLTTPNANQANDYTLALQPGDQLVLHYTDPSNTADVSEADLMVPLWNRVVDGGSGSLLNGIQLTLIDTATGQPAQVYGQDGASNYPSTVTSGQTVQDASGFNYALQQGNFLFPYVPPGTYTIRVDNLPNGYRLAEPSDTNALQQLNLAYPLDLGPASFGQPFTVNTAKPVGFDIALMPSASALYVTIQGDRRELHIGDMSQYTATVENTSISGPANQVELVINLAPGFRYTPGSLQINGNSASDPVISADGSQMTLQLGTLAANETVNISYVARVTVGAKQGEAKTLAQATALGGITSNLARYLVVIRYELMQSVNTLIGSVSIGCNNETPASELASTSETASDSIDLSGIRILLETGRYAITDKLGRYHFPQLGNGTHVVQVDQASLPPGYKLAPCEQNTRFAGSASSQFVELHGGALWRADFYLKPITGSLALQMAQRVMTGEHKNQIHTRIDLDVTTVAVNDLSLMVSLAPGLHYLPGSSKLGDETIADPELMGNILVYRLGGRAPGWKGSLSFIATPTLQAPDQTRFVTSAYANFATSAKKSQHTDSVKVALPVTIHWNSRHDRYVVRYGLGNYLNTLKEDPGLAQLLDDLGNARDIDITAIGNADAIYVLPRAPYDDNQQLSQWRAEALVDYLKQQDIQFDNVAIQANGSDNPVASNHTLKGRAQNRRVEAKVGYEKPIGVTPHGAEKSQPVKAVTKGRTGEHKKVPEPPVYDKDAVSKEQHYTLNQQWLNWTDASPAIVWPKADAIPAMPATQVVVKHTAGDSVQLFINGEAVSSRHFLKQSSSASGGVVVDQWLGISLDEGDNKLEAVVLRNDEIVTTLTRQVHFSSVPVRVEVIKEKSWLVADGQNRPFVAVRFYDRWGKPVRPGVTGYWQVNNPYMAWQNEQELQRLKVIANAPRKPEWTITKDGLAYLVLEPTTDSGKVQLSIPLLSGEKQISAWLKPVQRDWLLVGLATGTVAFGDVADHMEEYDNDPDNDLWQGDRVAFYAKGTVLGEYLITAAYDSAKETDTPQSLEQVIDPNKYYMLYADASQGGFDVSSAKKLYVKVERGKLYAFFGDYDTGLTVTDLSRYTRRLTGIKSSYEGEHFGYSAFAANNTHSGVQDEIQGNGTSGLYQLSFENILLNSETIRLVTRDRFTNEVVETQTLSPFIDYNVDYIGGTVFFRRPVPVRDENFNPVYIVADYEVARGGDEATTAGGRAFVKMADEKFELGLTAVREGAPAGENSLVGLDFEGRLSDSLILEAEAVHTETGTPGTQAYVAGSSNTTLQNAEGNGYKISLKNYGEKFIGRLYYENIDDGFGLGQQSMTEIGIESYGYESEYRLTDQWSVTSRAHHESSTNAQSERVEAGAAFQNDDYSVNFGLRSTQSESQQVAATTGGTGNGESVQAYLGGRLNITDKLSVNAQTSQAIGDSEDKLNPASSQLGIGYALSTDTRLFINQTFTGQSNSLGTGTGTGTGTGAGTGSSGSGYSRMTEIGMSTRPLAGAQLRSSITQQQTGYGPRIFSTSGLTQGWKVNEKWSLSVGLNRSQVIQDPIPTVGVAPGAFGGSSDFTSAFIGSGYRGDDWTITNRVEWLNSEKEERYGVFAGFYRELSEGANIASSLQLFTSDFITGGSSKNLTLRIGVAWRPLDSNWSILNQMDYVTNEQQGGGIAFNSPLVTGQVSPASDDAIPSNNLNSGNFENWRLVNNLSVNYKPEDARWQASFYYGAKYARYNYDVGSYNSYTDLIGLEGRWDLSPDWDIGVVFNRLNSYEVGIHKDGYGIETGFNVAPDMWLSVGYNFKGFYDKDFTAANYTAQGPYLRFRFKFDSDTLKAMAGIWE